MSKIRHTLVEVPNNWVVLLWSRSSLHDCTITLTFTKRRGMCNPSAPVLLSLIRNCVEHRCINRRMQMFNVLNCFRFLMFVRIRIRSLVTRHKFNISVGNFRLLRNWFSEWCVGFRCSKCLYLSVDDPAFVIRWCGVITRQFCMVQAWVVENSAVSSNVTVENFIYRLACSTKCISLKNFC